MSFYADLHIHSKYSRATSRDLDLERLAQWAARKGIAVVGTGDCVHPAWLAELRDKLAPAGNGLFRLRPDIEAAAMAELPPACRRPVSFMLSTEISTIYKKGDKTRKVHHLIYTADFDATERLAARLARIGNIASDGRPILGLDSRDLLEIALESGPDSYFIPAHVWTPWFAALGSQSGFESIEACYGDLAPHIFAIETGLSSDPAMNWRVSSLDRFRLVSNSDAHSPGKLGREATVFTGADDYFAIRHALATGEGYGGTVEFFPEEGKYHLDGHRACGVRLEPGETLALGGRCPACGRPVTVGVVHRIESLADRDAAGLVPPPTAGEVRSLVPLPEMLGEILRTGPGSKAVAEAYGRSLAALGPELDLLWTVPLEDVARLSPLLGEAVSRLRAGRVIREAGYDGEYGVIRLFEADELSRLEKGEMLFAAPLARRKRAVAPAAPPEDEPVAAPLPAPAGSGEGVLAGLDPEQAAAAAAVEGPLLVIAGPGSGKTRMLTHRIAHLVLERGAPASSCLAVTFTRKATGELRSRLAELMGDAGRAVGVHSFHSLGLAILRAEAGLLGLGADFRVAPESDLRAALAGALGVSEARARRLMRAVSVLKRRGAAGSGEDAEAGAALAAICRERGWVDFDDLVGRAVELLERHPEAAARWRGRFRHVVADEFQDVDEQQYRLLTLLAGEGSLCVIGDPDQAIYGFRGADASCFARFAADHPGAPTLRLLRNYRSTATIVAAASGLIGSDTAVPMRVRAEPVVLHAGANEAAEADYVAQSIEAVLGGHDLNTVHRAGPAGRPLGFADCAVLYRTDAQAEAIRTALDRAGIPFGKSSPAPLSGHAGVLAILRALGDTGSGDLAARIGAAAEAARREGLADVAALAEAKGWLVALAAEAADAARLREAVALSTEADFRDARADRVSLMTMHAAKGLEFAVVFVVGLEAGLMPLSYGPADQAITAEERRLLYVAMTRARDRLFLTRALERHWRGALRNPAPSPFLAAIPPDLTCSEAAPRRRRRPAMQLSLF